MRQFRRPAVTVPTLAKKGAGGKKRDEDAEDYEKTGVSPSDFDGHRYWVLPDVRGALYAMHGRVCGYCGADVRAAYDVEHFRPKGKLVEDKAHGGYWWLAYEFSNYLLGCVKCNQRCKGSRFPMRAGAVRVRYQDRKNLAAEQRVLVDPACDTVEELITVDWSKPGGKLVPKAGLTADEAARVEEVIKFFRLNLRVEERRDRADMQREVIEKIAENKADEVRSLAIRYRPHSLVAKVILEETGQKLPSPEEELEWLLQDLCETLILKREILKESGKPTKLDQSEADELYWALAVLWKDPPAGGAQFVEDFLGSRGLKEDVRTYLERL